MWAWLRQLAQDARVPREYCARQIPGTRGKVRTGDDRQRERRAAADASGAGAVNHPIADCVVSSHTSIVKPAVSSAPRISTALAT